MSELTWKPENYEPKISGSAAVKLSKSAVAPLVALAAGMISANSDTVVDVASGMGITDKRSNPYKTFMASANPDLMAMPWFSFDAVSAAQQAIEAGIRNVSAQCTSPQWRPCLPILNESTGKSAKYLFAAGVGTTIGIHPATPYSWIGSAPTILIAEGMLKGYSAMTAWMVESGVSPDDLLLTGATASSVDAAREQLNGLLAGLESEGIPPLLVIILPGVGNWHNKSEWNSLPLAGRSIHVAFDADMGSNPAVWSQARQLTEWFSGPRRATSIDFLAPTLEGDAKSGVDDFLASGKTFSDLLATAMGDLPDRPEGDVKVGDIRMDDVTCSMQKYVDQGGSSFWSVVHPLAGRISTVRVPKEVTWNSVELHTGNADPTKVARGSKTLIEIELSEQVGVGEGLGNEVTDEATGKLISRGFIRGPHEIAALPAERWATYPDVDIDYTVTTSPNWPPTSTDWARAMKTHRRSDIFTANVWGHMLYVPTNDPAEMPVFIVGPKVITLDGVRDKDSCSVAIPGVTNENTPLADFYGANDPLDGNHEPLVGSAYKKAVLAAIKLMLDTFGNGSWSDPRIAAVMIGSALRPAIPTRPSLCMVIYGPSNVGKTWTAKRLLAFWSDRPGVLQPGSARDTYLATELAISATPFHVSDDLAPSPDRASADRAEGTLGELIRSVSNGISRSRGTSSLKLAKSHPPRGVYVVTAENAMSGESQMNRALSVATASGYLAADHSLTETLVDLTDYTSTCNEVTTALIRHMLREASQTEPRDRSHTSWSTYVEAWVDRSSEWIKVVQEDIEGSSSNRIATIATEPLMALEGLQRLAEWAGGDEEFVNSFDQLFDNVISYAVDNYIERKDFTAGSRMISALSSILSSGAAYITGEKGEPPVLGSTSGRYSGSEIGWNQLLGWKYTPGTGYQVSGGASAIGESFFKDGRLVVMFHPENAFRIVAQQMSQSIQPGSKPGSSWLAVRTEGLTLANLWSARGPGGSVRVQHAGRRYSGIPILLDLLVDDMDEGATSMMEKANALDGPSH